MLSTEYSNNKASDIKLVSLYLTIKMMHGPINIRLTNLILFEPEEIKCWYQFNFVANKTYFLESTLQFQHMYLSPKYTK